MRYLLFFLFILIAHVGFGQFGLFGSVSEKQDKLHRQIIQYWDEIESERTVNSSTYVKPDGQQVYYFSREAVNYADENGKLQPVSTIPEKDEIGWHATRQKTPFSVLESGAIVSGKVYFSGTEKFNEVSVTDLDFNHYQINDTLILKDIVPGIDKYFQFRNNGIKYSYLINQPFSLNADLVIEESMAVLDENYSVILNDETSDRPGFVSVFDENRNLIYTVAPVWCYDAAGNTIIGKYGLEKISTSVYKLKLFIPQSYFTQAGLTYPVVIDPLVTGPTTTWAGGTMPSCFTPNYNVDSIQITVPGQISVTNLNVTSNYYASPFTTTVMADGKMFFSTDCNNSTTFTVAPPTGNSAGTAYLDNYNLNSPLMCCFDPQCNAYTFYLKMHLQRTTNGNTCNTTYLYYDPTSIWPFSAYVMGYTIENYGAQALLVNPTNCSNDCTVQLKTYSHYGVAPYVLTHPWLSVPDTAGVAAGCNNSITVQTVTLEIPNCPTYCDTTTSLTVPPPTITDLCGNVVSSWPDLILNIKPTPHVEADTITVCSGETAVLFLDSCLSGTEINWSGHSTNGTGAIIVDSNTVNTSSTNDTILYTVYGELNGCIGDTSTFVVITEPMPVADFTLLPEPAFILDNIILDDNLQSAGTVVSWTWTIDGNYVSSDTMVTTFYPVPGEYVACLNIMTDNGCVDTICKNMTVLPLELILPNVITPNGDLVNDHLVFTYLEFFESNHITILNRWGNLIYEKDNYQNDWNGDELSEGVYYYILLVEDKEYSGYFHLMK